MKRFKIYIIIIGFFVLLILPTYLSAGTVATVTVRATVLQGENSISVDTSLVDFGAVSGSVTNRRFVAGPVKISYFAGSTPWTIVVWTNNGTSEAQAGLKGDDGSYLPLKVWCDNYGPRANPRGNPPDEENQYFWNGYKFNADNDREDVITDGSISEPVLGFDVNGDGDENDIGLGTPQEPVSESAVWLWVPELSTMDMNPNHQNYKYTWRRLAYSGAELDPQGFPVYFAIDVSTGVKPQEYKTTTLTFQMIGD